jgi:hypothetical protein
MVSVNNLYTQTDLRLTKNMPEATLAICMSETLPPAVL